MRARLALATEDLSDNLRNALDRAAAAECEGVRLNARADIIKPGLGPSGLRQLAHYVAERNLQIAALFCPTRHALSDPQYADERVDVIRRSMKIAAELRNGLLVVRCGSIPDPEPPKNQTPPVTATAKSGIITAEATGFDPFGFDALKAARADTAMTDAQRYSLLVEILNDLTGFGSHHGCTLQLLLSRYRPEEVSRLLGAVTQGPLQIAFDPATAVMSGRQADTAFRDMHDRVGFIRARDALDSEDGGHTEAAVGDGTVAWDVFMATLSEADYKGWISVERTTGEDRSDDALRGLRRLRRLLPAID